MAEYVDENTLFKVRDALIAGGWDDGVTDDIIRVLNNAGILFREMETAEQASKRIIEEVTTQQTEVEYELMQPVSKEEFVRLESLHMATQTIPLNRTGNEDQFIARARIFEHYIRTGEFEENNNA